MTGQEHQCGQLAGTWKAVVGSVLLSTVLLVLCRIAEYFPEEEINTAEQEFTSASVMCMNEEEPVKTSQNRTNLPALETTVHGDCRQMLLWWPQELPNAALHTAS